MTERGEKSWRKRKRKDSEKERKREEKRQINKRKIGDKRKN